MRSPDPFNLLSLLLLFLSHVPLATPSTTSTTSTTSPSINTNPENDIHGPTLTSARRNSIPIFNALHAAGRQWGSALQHNGMSFFRASVPRGTLLYHGSSTREPVNGMEWVALEIEHAEIYAGGVWQGVAVGGPVEEPGLKGDEDGDERNGQKVMMGGDEELRKAVEGEDDGEEEDPPIPSLSPPPPLPGIGDAFPGYLHTYQTTRPLSRLLYLDGLSAAKTTMGTLDTQDLILRNLSHPPLSNSKSNPDTNGGSGEWSRARDLCAWGRSFNIEGFVRLEAGTEIIVCDFAASGLDLVSARRRPERDAPEGEGSEMQRFEFLRGVAARYGGVGVGGRLRVHYGEVVSAFFYPLDLRNPDVSRRDLPRLVNVPVEGRERLRRDVERMVESGMGETSFAEETENETDWQGVVDMIVSRYADRLQFMVMESTSATELRSEINVLLSHFIDYEDVNINLNQAKSDCAVHYLKPVTISTASQPFLYAAVHAVSSSICNTLFDIRAMVVQEKETFELLEEAKTRLKELMISLDWTTWRECGKCEPDKVCHVAICPWGTLEDHYWPRCMRRNETARRYGYWKIGG